MLVDDEQIWCHRAASWRSLGSRTVRGVKRLGRGPQRKLGKLGQESQQSMQPCSVATAMTTSGWASKSPGGYKALPLNCWPTVPSAATAQTNIMKMRGAPSLSAPYTHTCTSLWVVKIKHGHRSADFQAGCDLKQHAILLRVRVHRGSSCQSCCGGSCHEFCAWVYSCNHHKSAALLLQGCRKAVLRLLAVRHHCGVPDRAGHKAPR